MPRTVYSTRIGRSQGTNFFWGLVSVFFTAAACYYYWQNQENEQKARVWHDQVLTLLEDRQTLGSQKNILESGLGDQQKELDARDAMLKDKEAKLNEEQQKLESVIQQQNSTQQEEQTESIELKKFDDQIHQLAKSPATEVSVKAGFPVLSVPNSFLFPPGDSVLKPEGEALLKQLIPAFNKNLDQFELRVEIFSDGDAATINSSAQVQKPHEEAKSVLSAERAAALTRFFNDTVQPPAGGILVFNGRDALPIVPLGNKDASHNRRTEFSLVTRPKPGTYDSGSSTVSAPVPPGSSTTEAHP